MDSMKLLVRRGPRVPLGLKVPMGLVVAFACTLSTGCFQPDGVWDQVPEVVGPEMVGDRLVFGDRTRQGLLVARLADGGVAAIERVPLQGAPSAIQALPDGTGVAVLQSEAGVLSVVRFDGGPQSHWPLGANFTGLRLSPESNAVLAFFAKGADSNGGVFANTNEVAFVELASGDDAPPLRRSLAGLGGTPESFHVSPQLGSTRYAFVLSTSHVAIVDLTRPTSAERSVPLVSLVSGGVRTPKDVVFAVDDTDGTLWSVVTTTDGDTAFALQILPTDAGGDEAPFDVRLTQLAGVGGGADVALTRLNSGQLVALLANRYTDILTVTDLATASSQTIDLGSGVERIDIFTAEDRPHALVYAPGRTAFHIVDIEGLSDKKVKAARTRHAHRAIQRIIPVAGTALFGAVHDDAEEAFSIIDTTIDRVTPFLQTGLIRDVVVATAQDIGAGPRRVFLLTHRPSEQRSYLVSVTLDDFHPEVAEVFGPAERLMVLAAVGTVAVVSTQQAGQLQVWPAGATTDEQAQRIPNLFAHDLVATTGDSQ